jgi:hypothetical protein
MAKWVASISMFLRERRVLKRLLFLDFPFKPKLTHKILIHLSFSESDLKECCIKTIQTISVLLPPAIAVI